MSAPFNTEPVLDFSDLANQFVANTCSHNCDYTCKRNYGVRGRLTASKQWWYDNLQLSKLVMSVLVDGYVIPFVEEPPSCYDKFKYENLVTLSEMFKVGYWFFTFDIESGYHHIDIHPSSRKFLGFSFVWPDGRVRYFVFNVLPFGLSSACYVFTKIFRPFVHRWREFG